MTATALPLTLEDQALALAERAKTVGWRVEPLTGIHTGHTIFMPACNFPRCNHVCVMHTTATDENMDTWRARLTRHGLEKWEQQKKFEDAKRGLGAGTHTVEDHEIRALEARQYAEKKSADLIEKARNQALLKKAAGPYQTPELVDLAWFLDKHPAPWMRWVVMTPEIAQAILDKANTDNRPLSDGRVDHYEQVILTGQWHLTHQGVAFDSRGVLQDGQHRLKAVVDAGLAVAMCVFVGMDPENFKAIDEGLLRTAAHLFGRDGESNVATLSAALKLVAAYETDNPRRTYHLKTTNETMYNLFAADKEELRLAAKWSMTNHRKMYATPGPLAAARFLIRNRNGVDNPVVEAFFHGLATGRKMDPQFALAEDDPRGKLRYYYWNLKNDKKSRLRSMDSLALIVRAWNYTITDQRKKNFRSANDMAIPAISLYPYGEGLNTVAPPLLTGEIPAPAGRES